MARIEAVKYNIEGKLLIIRNALVEDAPRLIELIKKLDTETSFLLREPDEFNMTVEMEEKFLEEKLDSETGILIIAEVDGNIIGSCSLEGSKRKRLRHAVNLGIALTSEYWGLGIGRKLMESAISWSKENEISRITLQVDAVNYRALSLYTKLGFQVEGTFIKDKLLSDGTYRNSYAMALLL